MAATSPPADGPSPRFATEVDVNRALRVPLRPSLLLALCAPALACPTVDGADGGAADADAGAATDAGVDAGPIVCADVPAGVSEGRTGATSDTVAQARRAIVLMGGSAEVDDASRVFVESAGGGDVLVLRASGSTESYLPYFESELSPSPAPSSVAVLRTDDPTAANAAVACRVTQAEAVWLAGGDQWNYLGGWPAVLHDALRSTEERGTAIGGTSAGAMVLGGFAFDASLGSFDSSEALLDPTADVVSVVSSALAQPELAEVLIDTHFSERDREGRLLAMLARARALSASGTARAIGIDERAAILIDGEGFAIAAEPGRSVWVYRFSGEANLSPGERLTMAGVERVRLEDRVEGAWPIDFTAWSVEIVDVTDGVVTVR
jgi:cyanophycinase-like exopeptidase